MTVTIPERILTDAVVLQERALTIPARALAAAVTLQEKTVVLPERVFEESVQITGHSFVTCPTPFVFSNFNVILTGEPDNFIVFSWNTNYEKVSKYVKWRKIGSAWRYPGHPGVDVDPPATSFSITSTVGARTGDYEWHAWNKDACDNSEYSDIQTFTVTWTPFGGWSIIIT